MAEIRTSVILQTTYVLEDQEVMAMDSMILAVQAEATVAMDIQRTMMDIQIMVDTDLTMRDRDVGQL